MNHHFAISSKLEDAGNGKIGSSRINVKGQSEKEYWCILKQRYEIRMKNSHGRIRPKDSKPMHWKENQREFPEVKRRVVRNKNSTMRKLNKHGDTEAKALDSASPPSACPWPAPGTGGQEEQARLPTRAPQDAQSEREATTPANAFPYGTAVMTLAFLHSSCGMLFLHAFSSVQKSVRMPGRWGP